MHFANSGEQALCKLSDGIEPSLIVLLSDINMPGMDGLQLLAKIKHGGPDLPVMMVTAYGDASEGSTAGALRQLQLIVKVSQQSRPRDLVYDLRRMSAHHQPHIVRSRWLMAASGQHEPASGASPQVALGSN